MTTRTVSNAFLLVLLLAACAPAINTATSVPTESGSSASIEPVAPAQSVETAALPSQTVLSSDMASGIPQPAVADGAPSVGQNWRGCDVSSPKPDLEACGWPSSTLSGYAQYTSTALAAYVEPSTAAPFLPWPPPRPASFIPLNQNIVATGTFSRIAERITATLKPRGYDKYLYYRVPGGFALATELERFEYGGSAVGGEKRFQRGKLGGWGGFPTFFERLIFGEDGRFRVFVFVVTSKPFLPENYQPTGVDVDRWRSTGAPTLPRAIAVQRAPRGTTVTLMVYEFVEGRGRDSSLKADPRWTPPAAHLRWLGFRK